MKRATRKRRTKRSEIGNSLWDSVTDDWKCPACQRFKQEILRKIDGVWTRYPGAFTWSIDAPEGHMPLINQLRGVRLMDALLSHKALKSRQEGKTTS